MTTRSPDRPLCLEFHVLAIALVICAPACKDDKPKEGEAAKTAEATEKAADESKGAKATDEKGGGLGEAVADAVTADSMSAAGALTRGSVLAHVMFPDPSALLGKIKRQAAPEGLGMFLEPAFIKEMASGQLGSRGDVAKNLELDKPIACVLVDGTASPFPIACTMGYLGGAEALVTDMGADGKEADAGGTKGHYVIAGQHVFIDALGDRVVIGTDADAIAKAKPYLEKNIIGRADENLSDIEVVGYVSAAMTRYEKELAPIISEMGKPGLSTTDSPVEKAVAEYMLGTNKDTVERFKQMEQVTFGLGFHEEGFTSRWAVFPTPGSEFETELKAVSSGPVDLAFVEKLPENSVMFAGVRFDGKLDKIKSLKTLRDAFVTEYAKEVGKDPAAVGAAIDAFLAEETALYGSDLAVAMTYEPGTLGGVVLEVPLKDGKSGREGWKAWSGGFASADILGPKGSTKITWSFKADAATLGGTPVDRWTIELTKEALAEIEKESPENFAAFKTKWKSLAVTIDRAEVDGRAIFVLTPGDGDKYMQSAIDAVGGKGALSGNPGYKTVAAKNAKVSAIYALDVKRGADFVRQLIPAAEAAKIPAAIGNDLSDISFSSSYGRAGSQAGEFNASQKFIDQIRALAN